MSASAYPGYKFAKTTVKPVAAKVVDDAKADRKGSAEVRKRSKGQCEVSVLPVDRLGLIGQLRRCGRPANQVHHMIGGRGKRGIGISALKEHKQHVCNECHDDITGRVGGKRLVRVGGRTPQWTDHYMRQARAK